MPEIFKPAVRLAVILPLAVVTLAVCSTDQSVPSRAAEPPAQIDLAGLKPEFDFRGTILFQSDADGDNEIYALTRDGVRKMTDNAWNDEYPRWAPDGTRFAFAAAPRGNFDIFVMNGDGSGLARVTESSDDETEPAWLPDGQTLAFTRDDTLWTIDLTTKATATGPRASGEPKARPLTRRVLPDFSRSHGLSDFSPAAPLAAFTGKRLLGWDVFVHDLRTGATTPLTDGGKSCRPHFSRDGSKIAYVSSVADGKGDIWLMNPDGSGKARLTERDATSDYFPAWSPDDKYIVFCSSEEHSPRKGRWSLFLVKVGTKLVIPLFSKFERALFPDWR